MQHDKEVIASMRKSLTPFDADGNYQPQFSIHNNDYDRVFCSRFYYNNKSERLNVYFLRDGSVIVSDQFNQNVLSST